MSIYDINRHESPLGVFNRRYMQKISAEIDPISFYLYEHLCRHANEYKSRYRRTTICRGQYVSSITMLADETVITVAQVRRALETLRSEGHLTQDRLDTKTLFTITNYEEATSGLQDSNLPAHVEVAREYYKTHN